MKLHATPFLGSPAVTSLDDAAVVVLPVPYEGGVSYGRGSGAGPQAILEASAQVEFYDALLKTDSRDIGIVTVDAPDASAWDDPATMAHDVERAASELVTMDKFVVTLGGDHSISPACVRAQAARYPSLGVVQFDAHADLRPSYENSPLSHACAMARIRETTSHTLQLGIRSLCSDEAQIIENRNLPVLSVRDVRADPEAVQRHIENLPPDVYVTIDVDAFDGSVVWSTGTPEPGGFLWYEMIDLLGAIFATRNVVGVDIVELAPREDDINSAYTVARLAYHIIGLYTQARSQQV